MHGERQRRAGIEVPDFRGILHPMPSRKLAFLQKEIDRGRMAARASRAVAKSLGIPAALGMRLKVECGDDFGSAGHEKSAQK
ncbi:hypothetical protein AU467_04930 [Mesorhizobium loti]|uniref:Uncharacterized protein n=1 Tax=Rhizobium loti TaxID=381 RepID=A0A101KR16_RHILI|nr:hypothetical protein AU467_04930 [Mesorhizobium loti]